MTVDTSAPCADCGTTSALRHLHACLAPENSHFRALEDTRILCDACARLCTQRRTAEPFGACG